MSDVLIGFGSNLGDRLGNLARGLDHLVKHPGLTLHRASPVYETEPVGGPTQGRFLNACAVLGCDLDPLPLLAVLQQAEEAAGRVRLLENGPRTLDLDLLLYGDQVLDQPGLRVPHPRMDIRAFVLVPACDVAATWIHPGRGRPLLDLLPPDGPPGDIRWYRDAADWTEGP